MKREHYDTLIMKTPDDFRRLAHLHTRIADNIPHGRLIFIGNAEVVRLAEESEDNRITAIDEDTILPFADVHACMKRQMEPVLQGRELPRGITGWYYQQFLKWEYARQCKDEYYLVWDGDTIPCRPLSMFQEGSGKPYFDLKHEHHEAYFRTLERILPGMTKVIGRSFISEHMLINREICLQLMKDIEANDAIEGTRFWEKIIHAIDAQEIQDSAFSEFETYGTYVALKRSSAYMLRDWHSFRLGGEFFDPLTISERDFAWLAKDFDAISFEKGMSVREDHRNLFDNPKYQEKLTPRQMLEAAQQEFEDGYIEVWGEQSAHSQVNVTKEGFAPDDRYNEKTRYLDKDAYQTYERLGDSLRERNSDQAYLCYENAAFLCEAGREEKERLQRKAEELKGTGNVSVKPVGIVILSYNNTYLMQQCLESIRTHCNPASCGVVVLDNASTDGVAEWLKEQEDISLLLSDENMGFPAGCNEAIRTVSEEYDILLLNNDTRMAPNALFWLRMALYSSGDTGASGSVSNYTDPSQRIDVEFAFPGEYVFYGAKHNVPPAGDVSAAFEKRDKLSGFCMLIKREVLDKTGLFDERFSPGYFEDTDLCIRIRREGYKLLLCKNSFIYHAGSQSFMSREDLEAIFARNYQYICSKWGEGTVEPLLPEDKDGQKNEGKQKDEDKQEKTSMSADDIKLIVWDMDDTFWEGIISEGDVTLRPEAVALVRRAVDMGIMNAICSKNDYAVIEEALKNSAEGDLRQYFVFPSIDWTAKAPRLKQLIEDMQLRPANVLFLDDSAFNLREAAYYLPEMQCAGPDIIGQLLQELSQGEAKDPSHKRLEQYRVLERKREDRGHAASNEQFLADSDIRISVDHQCMAHLDRIAELVARTNQLNYTKIRASKEELQALIASDEITAAVIHARDRYGDYGIVGFYALDLLQDRLIHFLFSCRALGMGVEQYVYQTLGYPALEVKGEIASPLVKEEKVTWIREEKAAVPQQTQPASQTQKTSPLPQTQQAQQTQDIFIKGPCDMDQIVDYLKQGTSTPLYLETNYVDERGVIVAGFNNLLHLKEARDYTEGEILANLQTAPFLSMDDFVTDMFDPRHRIVFFSMLSETHAGVYRHKETGFRVCFSGCNFDLTDEKQWDAFISGAYANHNFAFTKEVLEAFRESYTFEGSLGAEETADLVQWLRDTLPESTRLILLLGSEIEAEPNTEEFADHAAKYRAVNAQLLKRFGGRKDIGMIPVTDFITGQDCFAGCTNHFHRKVYYDLTIRFAQMVNS